MRVQQDPDRIPGRPVLAVLAAVMVITAGGVLSAWLIGDCSGGVVNPRFAVSREHHAQAVQRAQVTPTLLYGPPLSSEYSAPRERWLTSFGWVDQQAGIVHIPIERAMRLYVELHGSAGTEEKAR